MAEEDDEVSLQRGAVVEVLQKSVDGWWSVKVNNQVGLAPSTFLKKLENLNVQSLPVSQCNKYTTCRTVQHHYRTFPNDFMDKKV